jgi:hypothetical protein
VSSSKKNDRRNLARSGRLCRVRQKYRPYRVALMTGPARSSRSSKPPRHRTLPMPSTLEPDYWFQTGRCRFLRRHSSFGNALVRRVHPVDGVIALDDLLPMRVKELAHGVLDLLSMTALTEKTQPRRIW